MAGNAWEWCDEEYRAEMNETDFLTAYPEAQRVGRGSNVLRGGSWSDGGEPMLRLSCRNAERPENRYDTQGFRCVLELPEAF
jgi:formylglycine-generating enzyme required for sulfatase activity